MLFREAGAKDCVLCLKYTKTRGFAAFPETNDGRYGTVE
jgi:hypothetical protein